MEAPQQASGRDATPSTEAPSATLAVVSEKRPAAAPAGDTHLMSMCETLSAALNRVQKEVHAVEERQIIADRRVSELSSIMQGLQEEQLEQACSLERGQKTVAMRAKHALHTAAAVQQHVEQSEEMATALDKMRVPPGGWAADTERRMSLKMEEQRKWLIELTGEVNAMHGQRPAGYVPFATAAHMRVSLNGAQPPLTLTDRVVALERSQKAVTVSAKRALHTALVVNQQQKAMEEEGEILKCLGGGPLAELEEQWKSRYDDQNESINRLIDMVQELNDMTGKGLTGGRSGSVSRGSSRERSTSRSSPMNRLMGGGGTSDSIQVQLDTLAKKVEDMESHFKNGTSSHESVSRTRDITKTTLRSETTLNSVCDGSLTLQHLDRKIEKMVSELTERIGSLQATSNTQALSIRSITQQLPDIKAKLDQSWSHTLQLLERVREHDVRFELVRSTIEGQKQDLLDISDTAWVHENMTEEEMESRLQALAGSQGSAAGPPPPPFQTLPPTDTVMQGSSSCAAASSSHYTTVTSSHYTSTTGTPFAAALLGSNDV